MSTHTATTLAYVRTSAGVVQVDPDGVLPDDVDDAEVQRLVAAGVVKKAAEPKPSGDQSNGRGKGARQGSQGS